MPSDGKYGYHASDGSGGEERARSNVKRKPYPKRIPPVVDWLCTRLDNPRASEGQKSRWATLRGGWLRWSRSQARGKVDFIGRSAQSGRSQKKWISLPAGVYQPTQFPGCLVDVCYGRGSISSWSIRLSEERSGIIPSGYRPLHDYPASLRPTGGPRTKGGIEPFGRSVLELARRARSRDLHAVRAIRLSTPGTIKREGPGRAGYTRPALHEQLVHPLYL